MLKTNTNSNFNSWEDALRAAESVIAEGDLVFLDIPHFLFRNVAIGTNSWTSHVGVAFKDQQGQWIVSESTVPHSLETPLRDYLQKSSKCIFEIKRLDRPLTEKELIRMRATANSMLNRFYNLGFNFNSKRLFCSKFAYLVYQSIGIEAGRLETFKELLHNNPKVSLTFWKFWFLGRIPWKRKTITPASQLNDPQFISILKGT